MSSNELGIGEGLTKVGEKWNRRATIDILQLMRGDLVISLGF